MLFTSFFFCIKTPNFYLKMIRMLCLHVLGFLCFFLCNWVLICSVVFCIFLISSSFTEKSWVCLIFICLCWYWRSSISCSCFCKDWGSCCSFCFWILIIFFKKILFIYFRERGRDGERERNIDVQKKYQLVASCTPPTGNQAHNPGMCPDWESNQWPFGLWDDTQPTEPHQSGLNFNYLLMMFSFHLKTTF